MDAFTSAQKAWACPVLRQYLWLLPFALSYSATGCGASNTESDSRTADRELVSADQLKETDVWPHVTAPIVPGRNYVYCASFQLAWNTLEDDVLKGPLQIQGDPPLAVELSKRAFDRSMIDEASVLAVGGKADQAIASIREQLQRRFPQANVSLPDAPQSNTLLAFAYLAKTMSFREQFDRLKEPIAFRYRESTVPVHAFGFEKVSKTTNHSASMQMQVEVLNYAGPVDFVLRLRVPGEDFLAVAKIKPETTLEATLAAVAARLAQGKDRLGLLERFPANSERVAIPVVELATLRRFSELEGKQLVSKGQESWEIGTALQGIRWRLDESGARLESTSLLTAKGGGVEYGEREFVIDGPFLVYAAQAENKPPYFAMWIETPEVLEPVK